MQNWFEPAKHFEKLQFTTTCVCVTASQQSKKQLKYVFRYASLQNLSF